MTDEKKRSNIINIQKLDPGHFEKEQVPYTLICNNVINKCTNPIAGFIWIYLQSKPPTWTPCKREIMKRFNISERTYQRHMSYLSETNLVKNHMTRNEDGTIGEWKLKVLNGTAFNPEADDFTGVLHEIPCDHTAKYGVVVEPAPDKGFDHTAKYGVVDFHHTAKKPHSGEMAEYINTRYNTNKKKNPSISPQGEKKAMISLSQILADNPFNIPDQMISDWLEVRKGKKAKMTQTAWTGTNKVLKKLADSGLDAVECFESMVTSGWQGMKVSYFEKEIDALKPKVPLKYVPKEERAAEYERISAREREADQRKKTEIDAGKGFQGVVDEVKRRSRKEIEAQHETKRIELGLSVREYSLYVLEQAKKTDNG